jgi:para-aminobenzoate synthetase component 1
MILNSEINNVIEFYSWLRTGWKDTALLESLAGVEDDLARYTIVGAIPREVLEVRDNRGYVTTMATGNIQAVDSWVAVLEGWIDRGEAEQTSGPYQLGAIGYLGYEAMLGLLPKAIPIKRDTSLPEVRLVRYGAVLVSDRATGSSSWVVDDESKNQALELEKKFVACGRSYSKAPQELQLLGDLAFDVTKDEYMDSVQRVLEYIRAGDIFQANLTARMSGRYRGDLYSAYLIARQETPNSFFAFLDFPCPVLSTSPERFFKVDRGEIESLPIKGTAKEFVEGVDQKVVLEGSIKNRAENIMIADLARNDVGRVAKKDSVRVPHLCRTRKCNSIYHLESVVVAALRQDVRFGDILVAMCPPGSITGAPKIRATEIISEVERHPRGPYCGAIGFFGASGYCDTSVAIRIVYGDGEHLFMHAGGGIVIDSKAPDELDELNLKVEALRRTLNNFNVMRPLRNQIDVIDERIFALVADRLDIVYEVGRLKAKHAVPTMQSGRIAEMVERRVKQISPRVSNPRELVSELYDVLVRHSMLRQVGDDMLRGKQETEA